MGNGHGHNPGQLHNESKLAQSKFDVDEIYIIQKIWEDLADRTNGKGIDKETFLQYFPMTGLLGERLFVQFDVKKTGYIDIDDFVSNLAQVCRGSMEDKMRFLFNMYDTSHDNTVSKQELTTLLNQVPKHILVGYSLDREAVPSLDVEVTETGDDSEEDTDELQHVDEYTNHDIIEKAFEECDLNHEGRLSYEQFKMWVEKTPGILEYIESILPWAAPKDDSIKRHSQKDALPIYGVLKKQHSQYAAAYSSGAASPTLKRTASVSERPPSVSRNASVSNGETFLPPHPSPLVMPIPTLARSNSVTSGGYRTPTGGAAGFNSSSSPPHPYAFEHMEIEEPVRALLTQAMEMTHCDQLHRILTDVLEDHKRIPTEEEITSRVVSKAGYFWKRGNKLHWWNKRWCLLSHNCIYYYNSQTDVRPKGVIFLAGTIIEKVNEEASEIKGYYGIEIMHQDLSHHAEHHKHEHRVLYARSEQEREAWITILQHAAQVVPIEEDYVIGKELGRGRFSVVCECVRKATGDRLAVKIIEKSSLEADEKELLRTEIAALKLVHHPNIVNLEGLYETRTHMYIVMEKLVGGELFERIVGHPRFTETEAARLIRPLLEAVAYLHDVGIVHRDLKPENILCGENLEDIKIADFGLSKMLLPREKMDTACGTLSYVAPEVLTMQGYGKEADLWSIGVIFFLIVCGKLPFEGEDNDEIIRATINGEFKAPPKVWTAISEDTKSILQALLSKSPKNRITARDALKHHFFEQFFPYEPRHRRAKSIEKPNNFAGSSAKSAVSNVSK